MTQTAKKVTFGKSTSFTKDLNQRVETYFQTKAINPRDNLAMYLKTAIILGWVGSAWAFILWGPSIIWLKVLGCVGLGLGLAGIGFSIGHDANHGGYSQKKWINSLFSMTYDVIGISSYLWRFRHNSLHHIYTNILGHDVEIYGDGLVRMSPYMDYRWFHKFQHWFISFIYMIIPFYWSFADVYLIFWKQKYHEHRIPKPKPLDLVVLLGGKLIWLILFVGIPVAVGYSLFETIIGFCITYMTYGFLICHVFMLAHVMEPAKFIQPQAAHIDDEWTIFQIRTTVDFAPKNTFLNWYLGGLNYQVVHHLFPQICHIHYPKIAEILHGICDDYGITYHVYPTLLEALAANYRWLRLMSHEAGFSPDVSPTVQRSV